MLFPFDGVSNIPRKTKTKFQNANYLSFTSSSASSLLPVGNKLQINAAHARKMNLYAVLCMSKHAHTYVYMHVCVCVRSANCDAEGKAKQRPNYFEPVLVVVFVLLFEIVLDFALKVVLKLDTVLFPEAPKLKLMNGSAGSCAEKT